MPDRLIRYLAASPLTQDPYERDQLFQTIVDRRGAILIAPASTIPLAIMALQVTSSRWPLAWIAIDLLLTAMRWKIMVDAANASEQQRLQQAKSLVVLGAIWMLALGIAIYLCLTAGNPALTVVAAVIGTGGAATVASRNAATPRHALLLFLLLGVPFALGLLHSPIEGMLLPAALTTVWIATLYMFVRQNHASMLRLVKAETAARRAAQTDQLTGLYNRFHFEDRRSRLDTMAEANLPSYGLLCIDLDRFKRVNDVYGHAAGDRLLRAAADRMRENLRDGDTLFRVGGDEFIALLPAASEEDCRTIARRLIAALSAPFELDGEVSALIGASIGSACSGQVFSNSEALLKAADSAMYRAKANGDGLPVHAA